MSISSCDIGNPAYDRKPAEPKFDQDDYEDTIISAQQKDRHVTIKFEGYYFDHAFRIVKLSVDLGDLLECHFEYLEDQILESIGLRLNKKHIVLETKLEIV